MSILRFFILPFIIDSDRVVILNFYYDSLMSLGLYVFYTNKGDDFYIKSVYSTL